MQLKCELKPVKVCFASCGGELLNIVGIFKCVIELGNYLVKEVVDVYVASNLALKSDIILGRDFINICPLFKPALDLMVSIAKQCDEETIKTIEDKTFNIDFLMREYNHFDKPLTPENLRKDIEEKMPSLCEY